VAVFLSGFAATLAGASIRACSSDLQTALAHSWCGKAPPLTFATTLDGHCAGCGIEIAGLGLLGAGLAMAAHGARRRLASKAAR